jgi:hypothetical protein
LLLFSPKTFDFLPHIKKPKDQNIQNCNFTSGAVWVWNLVSHFEEHRLRVSENKVLRIFGPKREEDRLWKKVHNDELHSLYSSPNIVRVIKSRMMRWVGHEAHMGVARDVYMVLVGKPEVKRPLGRPPFHIIFCTRE